MFIAFCRITTHTTPWHKIEIRDERSIQSLLDGGSSQNLFLIGTYLLRVKGALDKGDIESMIETDIVAIKLSFLYTGTVPDLLEVWPTLVVPEGSSLEQLRKAT
jgi:hypothetical protein